MDSKKTMDSKKLIEITNHSGWSHFLDFVQEKIQIHEGRLHSSRGVKPAEQKLFEDEVSRKVIQELSLFLTLKDDIRKPPVKENREHPL